MKYSERDMVQFPVAYTDSFSRDMETLRKNFLHSDVNSTLMHILCDFLNEKDTKYTQSFYDEFIDFYVKPFSGKRKSYKKFSIPKEVLNNIEKFIKNKKIFSSDISIPIFIQSLANYFASQLNKKESKSG